MTEALRKKIQEIIKPAPLMRAIGYKKTYPHFHKCLVNAPQSNGKGERDLTEEEKEKVERFMKELAEFILEELNHNK